MARNIIQGIWSIFLYPIDHQYAFLMLSELIEYSHHGRLSSASTGRFAALLLPFEPVLFELKVRDSFTEGTSTSISSSSNSDILKY